jgi:hypothetical protein
MPSQGSRSANDEREAARKFIVISLVIIVGGRAHDDHCMYVAFHVGIACVSWR